MVQSGIDVAEGSVDRVGVAGCRGRARFTDEASKWTQQTHAQLDQQYAELETDGCQAVATARPQAFDQALGAQLAQVIAQLAETVLAGGYLMAGQDAGVQLAGGPVADEATWVKQGL